jgi:hypothetical protein
MGTMRCLLSLLFAFALFFGDHLTSQAAEPEPVTITIREKDQPVPCRVHLVDSAGKPQRAEGLPFWRDHFVCPGEVELKLSPGTYHYEIERGPEYARASGSLVVKDGEKTEVRVNLQRISNLAEKGWYGGDLHIHRSLEDIRLLMRAEDLHIGPVITWWNQRNLWRGKELPRETVIRFDGSRFYEVMAGEDERGGGALLYFKRRQPLDFTGAQREYPSPLTFVAQARKQKGTWIDIEKPFWWDMPVWVASGEVDSIGLANNHMCRSSMLDGEAWGRPRDRERFPSPRGNGFWTQEIYYHLLNSGIRLPPSAGSASGVLPNPVGYNRVYVYTGKELTWQRWWEGLKAGRSFVTNGPLLLCQANGHRPGHVFTAEAGKAVSIDLQVSVTCADRVSRLEVIQNGLVVRTLPVNEKTHTGSLGTVHFKESGWFLVRAFTDNQKTFRFASTAPYHVEIGDRTRRVDPRSVRFFLTWLQERRAQLQKQLKDAEQRSEVLAYHDRAREFWEKKLKGQGK